MYPFCHLNIQEWKFSSHNIPNSVFLPSVFERDQMNIEIAKRRYNLCMLFITCRYIYMCFPMRDR
jgi:hypothetical protein